MLAIGPARVRVGKSPTNSLSGAGGFGCSIDGLLSLAIWCDSEVSVSTHRFIGPNPLCRHRPPKGDRSYDTSGLAFGMNTRRRFVYHSGRRSDCQGGNLILGWGCRGLGYLSVSTATRVAKSARSITCLRAPFVTTATKGCRRVTISRSNTSLELCAVTSILSGLNPLQLPTIWGATHF